MASQICMERQIAAPMMTSHPLEATSDNDDVINAQIDEIEDLTGKMDTIYLKHKEDISKEIDEVKDRDQRWENELLPNANATWEIGDDNDTPDDDNQQNSAKQLKSSPAELRRNNNKNDVMRSSSHSQVSIDCDRQSVQFTNSGDFSPIADSPDEQTPTVSLDSSQNENKLSPLPETQGGRIFADEIPRKDIVDADTVVIEREDVPKTHLENFSKCFMFINHMYIEEFVVICACGGFSFLSVCCSHHSRCEGGSQCSARLVMNPGPFT